MENIKDYQHAVTCIAISVKKKTGLRFRFNHVYIHVFITSIKRT